MKNKYIENHKNGFQNKRKRTKMTFLWKVTRSNTCKKFLLYQFLFFTYIRKDLTLRHTVLNRALKYTIMSVDDLSKKQ